MLRFERGRSRPKQRQRRLNTTTDAPAFLPSGILRTYWPPATFTQNHPVVYRVSAELTLAQHPKSSTNPTPTHLRPHGLELDRERHVLQRLSGYPRGGRPTLVQVAGREHLPGFVCVCVRWCLCLFVICVCRCGVKASCSSLLKQSRGRQQAGGFWKSPVGKDVCGVPQHASRIRQLQFHAR